MVKPEYRNRKYTVVDYDPNWPTWFIQESNLLKKIFSDAVDIQHVGSTAVPGLAGKPTLDILVLTDNLSAADDHSEAMAELGYEYKGEYVKENTRLFQKMDNGTVLVNVHVLPSDHSHVEEMLGLRDFLRAHPQEAESYSKLKRDLQQKYPDDYGNYRKQKDVYMEEMQKRMEGV